jgi:GNAT superfamily N-acetyltransferase
VVARSDHGLVGGCVLVSEPTSEWVGRTESSLYVHKLVVARSHAGRGVGRRILAWCQREAGQRGARRLRLDCWDGNAKLRALYRACGYVELDAVKSHGYWVRLFELQP